VCVCARVSVREVICGVCRLITAILGQVYRTNDVLVLIHVATPHDREPVRILKSQRSIVAL